MRIWPVIASFAAVTAASIGGAAVAQGSSGAPAQQCRVKVDRSADAGTFDVVRQTFENGSCVCAVTTGPASQATSVEGRVSSIVSSRSCAAARSVAMTGQGTSGAAIPVGLLGSAAVIGGIILASDRPVSP
jgi:hypothetical protein